MEKAGYRETLGMLQEMFPGRATITVKEAATAMGANEWTVYESIKRVGNPLPHTKLGAKILIPIPAFARWLC